MEMFFYSYYNPFFIDFPAIFLRFCLNQCKHYGMNRSAYKNVDVEIYLSSSPLTLFALIELIWSECPHLFTGEFLHF
jgi:hypothetical protein